MLHAKFSGLLITKVYLIKIPLAFHVSNAMDFIVDFPLMAEGLSIENGD